MKTFNLVAICIIVFSSCQKDETFSNSINTLNCYEEFDYTLPGPAGDVYYSEDSIQFKFPTFNPNNSNEILYHYVDYSTMTFQLIKYNIQTNQKSVLKNNVFLINPPAWNKNGWIAYEVYGNKIEIIHQNGSGHSVLAETSLNMKPSWLNNTNEVVWFHTNLFNGGSYVLKKSIYETTTDTLIYPSPDYFVISNENKLLFSDASIFYTLDLINGNTYSLSDLQAFPTSLNGTIQGLCWNPEGTKFYASKFGNNYIFEESGLFEIDYPSGNYRQIIQFCDSKQYVNMACSPDGNYLILQRIDNYQKFYPPTNEFTGEIVRNSTISLINLNTHIEVRLDL